MRKVRIERNLMLMTTTLYKGTVMDLDDPLVPPHILRDIESELVHRTGAIVEVLPVEPIADEIPTDEVSAEDSAEEEPVAEDAEKASPMRRRKSNKK